MKLILLSVLCWVGVIMGASSSMFDAHGSVCKTISVKLSNGLDGTITIPALNGLVLTPDEAQDVVFPCGLTKLSFLYYNKLNGDHEIYQEIHGIRLSSIFDRCELRLIPDKDAGVTLAYNGLLLHELKAHQKLLRQETQPILKQIASVDRVDRRRQRKQTPLQQLRK